MKWLLLLLVLAMIVLHQDFWNWNKVDALFGFLPIGLAYHAAYVIACAVLMGLLARFAWPPELDAAEQELANRPAPTRPEGH